jgi:hypothetical protein
MVQGQAGEKLVRPNLSKQTKHSGAHNPSYLEGIDGRIIIQG